MSYEKKATELHEGGANCCQAVLCTACSPYGLSEEEGYRLGAFFGAGMRRGEVCGAVSGALMTIGLKFGDAQNRSCPESRKFMDEFEAKFGSLLCRELKNGQTKKASCAELIAYAANYLEEHEL